MSVKNKSSKIFFILLLAIICSVISYKQNFTTYIDGLFFDLSIFSNFHLQKLVDLDKDSSDNASSTVVIAVDEPTLAAPEAQVPRAMFSPLFAEVASKALQAGAKNVIFDVVMEFDTARWGLGGVERPEEFSKFDTPFLTLLGKHRKEKKIILARTASGIPAERFRALAGTGAIALAELPLDADGVIRQIPLALETVSGRKAFTLAGAALQLEKGLDIEPSILAPEKRLTALVPSVPMIDVIRCGDSEALQEIFQHRTVLIGSVLPDEDRILAPDRFISPSHSLSYVSKCKFAPVNTFGGNARSIPGVFYHAAAIDSLSRGLHSQLPSKLILSIVSAIASVIGAWLAVSVGPRFGVAALLVVSILIFVGSLFLMNEQVVVPSGRSILTLFIAFFAGWGFKILVLERRAINLRRNFGFYLAPQLVDRLANSAEMPRLDGEMREITVMFADLSGFTALSEVVDSRTLTETINRYLSTIAEVVDLSGGYVDKFIGDAVMAIWNAPANLDNHETSAVKAAWSIERQILAMAAADMHENGRGLDVKIAINSGLATVGNVGAKRRLSYSAIGETVNVAARFENLGPIFGVRTVVGTETARAVQGEFVMLPLADVLVRGKSLPITVWTPLMSVSELSDNDEAFKTDYENALSDLRVGNFDQAEEAWTVLASSDWQAAAAAKFMAASISQLREAPSIEGVFGYLRIDK